MTIYSQVSSNKRKTLFILIFFVVFIGTVSYVIAKAMGDGFFYTGIMLIISGLVSFFSYYYSDKMILSLSGAKLADPNIHKELFNIVENLTIASGLPMPKVYVVNDTAMNAFATGRDPKNAAIAATSGLLEKLKNVELEGVIAHELSHVKNYDTRLMGIVSILVGSLALLSDISLRSMWYSSGSRRRGNQIFLLLGLLFAVLAPVIATLIQLAVSRQREFLADADGALLTRYPNGLAAALQKIASDRHMLRHASMATAHLYIENPFKTDTGLRIAHGFANLFSTHPPVEERIRILREM